MENNIELTDDQVTNYYTILAITSKSIVELRQKIANSNDEEDIEEWEKQITIKRSIIERTNQVLG